MPAKPLTEEQKADAGRLKQLFIAWQANRRRTGAEWSQEYAGEQLGFGQSALSQYLNGKIPLNPEAAASFCKLLGDVRVEQFSPALAREMRGLLDEATALQQVLVPRVTEEGAAYRADKSPAPAPTPLVPPQPGARYLVMRLAELLRPLDKTDRAGASAILSALATDPDSAEEMAAKLVRLLGELPLEPVLSEASGGKG